MRNIQGHPASCGNVLVVEDDQDIRESLLYLLELDGYNALGAIHGRNALELLVDFPRPCIVLLDLMMPVMDGWQFLATKARNPELAGIPVVVISALDENTRPVESAIQAYIKKPINFDTLLMTVKRYCCGAKKQAGI